MQSFLKNSEQGKRDFLGGQRVGQIVTPKGNFYALLLAELNAEASHGSNNAQIF
jgi:hypothetical protein